jgi:transcriptional regulator of acetoin/glycerol metabolism
VHANLAAQSLEHLMGESGGASILERARGGTIYIDEVASLDAAEQAKLLYLMASTAPSESDAERPRIIAASTRDLSALVRQGSFRPDLYSRLAVFEGRLPALRERREDLGLLVRALSRTREGKPAAVTTSAFRRILAHRWPFNVRELGQTLTAALAVGERDDTVTAGGLEEVLRHAADVPDCPRKIQSVREELLQQLAVHRGDTQAVAISLSCDHAEVQRWLRRFELDPAVYGSRAEA